LGLKEKLAQADTAAFDGMAQGYDAEFTATALGSVLRVCVWERMSVVFAGRERLLELGCGTGEDAVRLARDGHRVIAIDSSGEMIRIARRKALAAGCGERIEFHCLPIEKLHELPGNTQFDGVLSNFGAVNCVADIAGLANTLAELLVPGAPLLFVPMGRYVPWEWAWYLVRGDRRRAFRRLAKKGADWRGLTIRYPTPTELARELQPHFVSQRTRPLGFALPPSFAAGWLERSPRALTALARIERVAHDWSGCANLSDHYIHEAVRRDS
jgi:SAM-dependent methyltransferase